MMRSSSGSSRRVSPNSPAASGGAPPLNSQRADTPTLAPAISSSLRSDLTATDSGCVRAQWLRFSTRTAGRTTSSPGRTSPRTSVSQRHLPPHFLGHFSPVLRRLFTVFSRSLRDHLFPVQIHGEPPPGLRAGRRVPSERPTVGAASLRIEWLHQPVRPRPLANVAPHELRLRRYWRCAAGRSGTAAWRRGGTSGRCLGRSGRFHGSEFKQCSASYNDPADTLLPPWHLVGISGASLPTHSRRGAGDLSDHRHLNLSIASHRRPAVASRRSPRPREHVRHEEDRPLVRVEARGDVVEVDLHRHPDG